jgi:hypothetical protein
LPDSRRLGVRDGGAYRDSGGADSAHRAARIACVLGQLSDTRSREGGLDSRRPIASRRRLWRTSGADEGQMLWLAFRQPLALAGLGLTVGVGAAASGVGLFSLIALWCQGRLTA